MYKGLSTNERDDLHRMTKAADNQSKAWTQYQLSTYMDDVTRAFTPEQIRYMAWYLNVKVEDEQRKREDDLVAEGEAYDDHYFGKKG